MATIITRLGKGSPLTFAELDSNFTNLNRSVVITPYDKGCTTGLASDQTTNFQLAINEAVSSGKPLDLCGQVWRIDSKLNLGSNLEIRNGTINFAQAGDTAWLFEAFGSTGTQYTLTSAPAKGATSVSVSSATGLATGDWLFIRSNDDFSPGDSGKRGEWVRVLSVGGLTVNLEQRIRHTYTSGHTMYKPTLLENIRLRDLILIGKGNTGAQAQYAARFYLCKNVNLENCIADYFGYVAYSYETVLGGSVSNCQASRGNFSLGAAYGISITGGCDGITVTGGRYSYLRHGITVGGTYFTDFGITITGVNTMACSDAGIDVHPNAWNVVINGNTVDCFSTDTTQTGDGITVQAAQISVTNNTVRGWRRIGILAQPLTVASSDDDTWTITGNNLANPQGTSGADGITFSNEKSGGTIRGLVISGNTINGITATTGRGISIINTTNGGPIRGINISANTLAVRSEALYAQCVNLQLIEDIAIGGNSLYSVSTTVPVVNLVANTDASKFLSCITFSANTIRGGNYGIQLTNGPVRTNRGVNIIQGFATAATLGTFTVTDGTDLTT